MEDRECTDPGGVRQSHAFLPGRMTPAAVACIFLVGVARIVDHHVGTAAQLDDGAVALALAMFGVGDVADRLATVIDAITGGAVGMVERRGAQADRIAAGQKFAGPELAKLDACLEDIERHRVERRLHQMAHDFLQGVGRLEMARPHTH